MACLSSYLLHTYYIPPIVLPLLRQMNTQLDFELRVFVSAGTAVRLQMIHDRTTTATVRLIEFVLTARGEVPLGINVLEVELLGPLQELVAAAAANHNPIVAGVTLQGFAEARYLLLPTERTANEVRVQILFRVGMAQTDLLAALDGLARRTDFVIVGLPDYPKTGRLVPLGEERNDLLPTARSHLGRLRVEIIFPPTLHVRQLDGGTAGYSLSVCQEANIFFAGMGRVGV